MIYKSISLLFLGLDPAGPEFYDQNPGERLDMGDASFVDVIHTNYFYSWTNPGN